MKLDDATPLDLLRKIMIDARHRRVPRGRWSRKYSLGCDAGRASHVQQILPACRVHHGHDWPLAARSLVRSPDLTRASCISLVDDVLPVTAWHQTCAIQPSFKHSLTFSARHATHRELRGVFYTPVLVNFTVSYLLFVTLTTTHSKIITGRFCW